MPAACSVTCYKSVTSIFSLTGVGSGLRVFLCCGAHHVGKGKWGGVSLVGVVKSQVVGLNVSASDLCSSSGFCRGEEEGLASEYLPDFRTLFGVGEYEQAGLEALLVHCRPFGAQVFYSPRPRAIVGAWATR